MDKNDEDTLIQSEKNGGLSSVENLSSEKEKLIRAASAKILKK